MSKKKSLDYHPNIENSSCINLIKSSHIFVAERSHDVTAAKSHIKMKALNMPKMGVGFRKWA